MPDQATVTIDEFRELFRECRRQQSEAAGTVRPDRVLRATELVSTGTTISCARPVQTEPAPDNPKPALHLMTDLPTSQATPDGFAGDFLGAECHGDSQTHIDALCHIAWEGEIFSGEKASDIFSLRGATSGGLELAVDGLVGRGVLLDLPATEGVEWLEPGHRVSLDEVRRAEAKLPEPISAGDIVFVRTGHDRRRRMLGPWTTAEEKAGVDVHAMPWFASKKILAMCFDGDGDAIPHNVVGVQFPIHVLGIAATGLYFLDSLDLERLSQHCGETGRWDFLCVIAPLYLIGGTGSLINPIAMF